MSAPHTQGACVSVCVQVTDELARKLTGSDPAYFEATGNEHDARVIRARAQRIWESLIAIAKATGSAS